MHFRNTREGEDFTGPMTGIFGPKAMLINEYAGSGGDTMPWYFRKAKLGPLVGKRTCGGLVGGLGGFPQLVDGGSVTAPSVGFWDPETGEQLTPAMKHKGTVRLAEFSPGGELLVTAASDRTARVWDAGTGEPITPSIFTNVSPVASPPTAVSPEKSIGVTLRSGTTNVSVS